MTLPSWSLKLAAAAVIPVILGVGVAMSAPSQTNRADLKFDTDSRQAGTKYRSGKTGVDFASVTGPTTSQVGKTRECGDPSWPIVPFSCRDAGVTEPFRN